MAFNKNLDSFKETFRNIPVVAIANQLNTSLITSVPVTPYTPSTTSAYSSPSDTWITVNTPLANVHHSSS